METVRIAMGEVSAGTVLVLTGVIVAMSVEAVTGAIAARGIVIAVLIVAARGEAATGRSVTAVGTASVMNVRVIVSVTVMATVVGVTAGARADVNAVAASSTDVPAKARTPRIRGRLVTVAILVMAVAAVADIRIVVLAALEGSIAPSAERLSPGLLCLSLSSGAA